MASPAPPTKTIVQTAATTSSLSTLFAILSDTQYAGIVTALSGAGPFTVFAPNNDAFKLAGINTTFATDPANVAAVTAILQYHVVATQILTTDLALGSNFPTSLEGTSLRVNASNTRIGPLQPIVEPPTTTWRAKPGEVTVNAMASVLFNGADVLCTNGVVHIIDAVIMSIPLNVVETAQAEPSLSTFVAILNVAAYKPLLDVLSGAGSFTVFAPNNDAFALAGIDVAFATTQANVANLTKALQFHVVADNKHTQAAYQQIFEGDIKWKYACPGIECRFTTLMPDYPSRSTTELNVNKDSSGISVSPIPTLVTGIVQSGDLQSSNGVVHVINKVLTPVVQTGATVPPTPFNPCNVPGYPGLECLSAASSVTVSAAAILAMLAAM